MNRPPAPKRPHTRPRGTILEDGVSCGVCEAVFSIGAPSKAAVRSVARLTLKFTYLEAWGWVCPVCLSRIPGLRDPRRKRDPGPKPSRGPKRVQINMQIE